MAVTGDSIESWPTAQDVASALGSAKGSGDQWYASCPVHEDTHASLSIKSAEDGKLLINCHAGCPRDAVIDALKQRGLWRGARIEAIRPAPAKAQAAPVTKLKPAVERKVVATYDYCDEHGVLLYQKLRYEPKGFSQRVPDGNGWSYKLGNVRRVLYRLPELIAKPARAVFVVEGEKDADALTALGRLATCNDSGAGKWNADLNPPLAARTIFVVADNDDAGRAHVKLVGAALLTAACKVYTIEFTELPEHGDVSDWLAAHDVKILVERCSDATKGVAVDADGLRIRRMEPEIANAPEPGVPDQAPEPTPEATPEPESNVVSITDAPPEPLKYSEDDLGRQFMATRLDGLRYCHDWGHWLLWNGRVWAVDKTAEISQRVRFFCRDVATIAASDLSLMPRTRIALLGKLGTVALQRSIESMCKIDQNVALRNTDLDNDRMVIGTATGAWDLAKGQPLPNAKDRLITKATRFAVADEPSLAWINFVDWMTRGDKEVAAFLQRMAGYCLTGSIEEHALFFLYGPGGNGKSVFLNMLSYVFGDYATNANMETFMQANGDRHTTELARLQGARLVTALESEADRSWAEGKIKALTGGDRVTARYMRMDNFEYDPQFKLVLVGNHMPKLLHVDAAMRRRLHMVPFMAKVDDDKVDPSLPSKLREHGAGILRWCVDGTREWLRKGLAPPFAVSNATESYFVEEDIVFAFLRAKLAKSPGMSIATKPVFEAFCRFAKEAGERPMSAKDFLRAIAKHDIMVTADSKGYTSILGYSLEVDYSDSYEQRF